MWTNSTIVLSAEVHGQKAKCLNQNRVADFMQLTTTNECNYVQISENAAVAGIHELSAHALSESLLLKFDCNREKKVE